MSMTSEERKRIIAGMRESSGARREDRAALADYGRRPKRTRIQRAWYWLGHLLGWSLVLCLFLFSAVLMLRLLVVVAQFAWGLL